MKIAVRALTALGFLVALIGAMLLGSLSAALLVGGSGIFFAGLVDIIKESK